MEKSKIWALDFRQQAQRKPGVPRQIIDLVQSHTHGHRLHSTHMAGKGCTQQSTFLLAQPVRCVGINDIWLSRPISPYMPFHYISAVHDALANVFFLAYRIDPEDIQNRLQTLANSGKSRMSCPLSSTRRRLPKRHRTNQVLRHRKNHCKIPTFRIVSLLV